MNRHAAAGKIKAHAGAAPDLAVYRDVTARLAHEAVHLAEPKTRALSDALRGEEGFENLLQYQIKTIFLRCSAYKKYTTSTTKGKRHVHAQ